jgi:hypothetical protein
MPNFIESSNSKKKKKKKTCKSESAVDVCRKFSTIQPTSAPKPVGLLIAKTSKMPNCQDLGAGPQNF